MAIMALDSQCMHEKTFSVKAHLGLLAGVSVSVLDAAVQPLGDVAWDRGSKDDKSHNFHRK